MNANPPRSECNAAPFAMQRHDESEGLPSPAHGRVPLEQFLG